MGLDMNLYRKVYYGGEYKTEEKDHDYKERHSLTVGGEFAEKHGIMIENIHEIKITCGYWRKANQVHKFFCDSVNQPDLNGFASVSTKDIIELKGRCETIWDSNKDGEGNYLWDYVKDEATAITDKTKEFALDLLPPHEGFFFGGYDIDDWYLWQIKETIAICDRALNTPDDCKDWEWDYEYYASW